MPFKMSSPCIKVTSFFGGSDAWLVTNFLTGLHMQRFMAWVGGLHLVSVTLLTLLWFTSLHQYLGEEGDGACHLSVLLAFC